MVRPRAILSVMPFWMSLLWSPLLVVGGVHGAGLVHQPELVGLAVGEFREVVQDDDRTVLARRHHDGSLTAALDVAADRLRVRLRQQRREFLVLLRGPGVVAVLVDRDPTGTGDGKTRCREAEERAAAEALALGRRYGGGRLDQRMKLARGRDLGEHARLQRGWRLGGDRSTEFVGGFAEFGDLGAAGLAVGQMCLEADPLVLGQRIQYVGTGERVHFRCRHGPHLPVTPRQSRSRIRPSRIRALIVASFASSSSATSRYEYPP